MVPASLDGRIFAIGDIHGRDDMLRVLLEAIDPVAQDTLIFLGDFIDRGAGSRAVMDCIRACESVCHTVVILGNHEQMLLQAFHGLQDLRFWLKYGGVQTLQSFGLTPDLHGLLGIPDDYVRWLKSAQDYYETDEFIFSHATPYPHQEMALQGEAGWRWRKLEKAADPYDGQHCHFSQKTLVCGHSEQRDGRVYQALGVICLDTFAYGGGFLSALEVGSLMVWQIGKDLALKKVPLDRDLLC